APRFGANGLGPARQEQAIVIHIPGCCIPELPVTHPHSGVAPMPYQDAVLSRYPEAQAVEEPLIVRRPEQPRKGRWVIYAGPELDARVLGRGATEARAWADAARRAETARRRVRLVLAV